MIRRSRQNGQLPHYSLGFQKKIQKGFSSNEGSDGKEEHKY